MYELIHMPFGRQTRVGGTNHELDGIHINMNEWSVLGNDAGCHTITVATGFFWNIHYVHDFYIILVVMCNIYSVVNGLPLQLSATARRQRCRSRVHCTKRSETERFLSPLRRSGTHCQRRSRLCRLSSFRRALKTELFVRSFGSARHRP